MKCKLKRNVGQIMGPSGVKAVKEKLPALIKEKKIDFVVVNGEMLLTAELELVNKMQKIFLALVYQLIQIKLL